VRIVIDEDIPSELVPLFRRANLEVRHVEDIAAVAAFPTARKHAVTTIGVARQPEHMPDVKAAEKPEPS